MPNSLEFAKKFVPVIDGIYKAAGLTEGMDSATQVDFTGVNEVKVLKVSTTGLGEYDRSTGYPAGDITAAWETISLAVERGKELSIDRMDNEETLGLVFGEVTGQFMREYVIPELDAYRFAKYASTSGISAATAAILTASDILEAIDEAVRQMDEDEVPLEGRRLYINSDLKPILNAALTRQFGSDNAVNTVLKTYNDMPIVYVPKKRFYTAITLNDGSASWGYAKGATAKDINFMIIYPQSILQAKKFALPKIFTPDENQTKDAWKFQFRLYHDCYVYENKVKGIYLHPKATA
ncbi:hypothetical protein [Acetobacterium wieringae]|uniref:hypothetical protein n=1 Tax=Acetobacterium wieringae TaxID=52694 RepID=UPI002033D44D|nr:hypothetical protein [Acetobacterium wieringae]URN85155.1 hypothetical protein CHL1_000785 [Acetobacterium wieringae]